MSETTLLVQKILIVISTIYYFTAPIAAAIIFRKLGKSSWWGLIVLIPIVNMLWVWYVALASWPSQSTELSR